MFHAGEDSGKRAHSWARGTARSLERAMPPVLQIHLRFNPITLALGLPAYRTKCFRAEGLTYTVLVSATFTDRKSLNVTSIE